MISPRTANRIGNWSLNLLLIVIGLAMLSPFLWVVSNALLPYGKALSLPPVWIPTSITFENFREVFKYIPFGLLVWNSIKIATIVTVGSLATSVLAAYAFARLRFPGRDVVFVIFLAALMVPQQVTVIPIFIILRKLHLLDTHAGVFLPALINVFGIFLLRQFFAAIPRELEEAARMDGAGHLRVLWQIILPLSAPALGALAIFIFQASWNDFFWPNIILFSPDKMTLPVGLVSLQGQYGGGPAVIVLAGLTMLVAPLLVLFLFTQRTLTESIAMTGLKG